MIEFGNFLKEAREDAGLSLQYMHENTRINVKHLVAVESGNFPSVPHTYIRAFIREYALQVGLDPDEILGIYNELAAAEKGVPPPAQKPDTSHLIPKIDDTIEIVGTDTTISKHVEVEGKAEVQESEFTPVVKRSSYISTDHGEPIDIRTNKPAPPKQPAPSSPPRRDPPPPSTPEQPPRVFGEDTPYPQEQAEKQPAKPSRPVTRKEQDRPAVSPPESRPPQEAPATPNPEKRRRALIGTIIGGMAVVLAGMYWYFSYYQPTEPTTETDTTSMAAYPTQDFLDTTNQFILQDPEVMPDTSLSEEPEYEQRMEPAPAKYGAEDSLVLEAFTTAPVYYSVRMDTVRSEKGQLSSNDHKVWKARDKFVISLGDAGAITFFLNGRNIGSLGDEGLVVKNYTITRQSLERVP